jgi:hypothetical protein
VKAAILDDGRGLAAYLEEICLAWGLLACRRIGPEALPGLTPDRAPVLVCPAGAGERAGDLLDYVRRGGALLCFMPEGELAGAAGLEAEGEKEPPLRLRLSALQGPGLAGEALPVVGRAVNYRCREEAGVLAYLSHPGRYHGESPGLVETRLGRGRIAAFAFDLGLCVLLLRQGDPRRAEQLPPGDRCARPSHLAADIGPHDAAWIPYADLLARLFVEVICRLFPAPVPLLWHLPEGAAGLLLYSGDEDGAEVAWNDEQLGRVAGAGGRMNLYLIPDQSRSTREDVRRYAAAHDLGPHPNLRPLDGQPVARRLEEFERQIRRFTEQFGMPARSLRNHCTAWAGYLEPVEVMERLGVGMEGNYFSGTYLRDRQSAPYAGFGGAMAMRFCRPDGRLLEVFQQHTHLADDVLFGASDYSYKLSAAQFEGVLERTLGELKTRFHTPYAVCVHPSNWVKFSGSQGQALLRQAAAGGLPVWSFDQWLAFCRARRSWTLERLAWEGGDLRFALAAEEDRADLCLAVPRHWGGRSVAGVEMAGKPAAWESRVFHGRPAALIRVKAGRQGLTGRCRYAADESGEGG